MVAGAPDEIVQSSAFAAKHKNTVTGQIEAVVVGFSALVETDNPDVLLLQFFKSANEIDNPRYAKMFDCAGTGFHGHGTQWRGAAFRHDNAIDTCTIGHAKQRSQVLRVFDTIESQQQTRPCGIGRFEKVLDREHVFGMNIGHHALVRVRAGNLRQVLARFLADTNASITAIRHKAREAVVVALGGNQNVIEAALTGSQGFGDRVNAVEDFHSSSVDGPI